MTTSTNEDYIDVTVNNEDAQGYVRYENGNDVNRNNEVQYDHAN